MNKKTYTEPYLTVLKLDVCDVLTTSGGLGTNSFIKDSYDWLD